MANIELLDKVLDHIEKNPESWNQRAWRCGTTYCFAGHAALLSGWQPVQADRDAYWKLQGWESEEKAVEHYQNLLDRDREWYEKNGEPYTDTYYQEKILKMTKEVDNTSDTVTLTGEEQRSICLVATDVLEIDGETGDVLFGATNTLADLRLMVQAIKEDGVLRYADWEERDEVDDYPEDDEDEDY